MEATSDSELFGPAIRLQ